MTLILIIFCIWGASALARASKETKRQREIDRQRREQAARSAELARMTAEWKQRQAEAKIETQRLIALEREQMRQAREQERQAKEQERQAAQLAKHEERLLRLEQRMTLAEREIAHYAPMLEDLKAKARELDNRVWYLDSIGLPCTGAKNELTKINEKMYRIETKVLKAEQEKSLCEKQMSA